MVDEDRDRGPGESQRDDGGDRRDRDAPRAAAHPRDESAKERVDRELIELLNELRVALPGVQVLFAFLLVVPFSLGFDRVTTAQRIVYLVSFLATATASALLIAPSAHHRLQFRSQQKERLLLTANKLAIAGIAFLALAIVSVVYLISDVLYGVTLAVVVTTIAALLYLWFWWGLPLRRRREERDRPGPGRP